MHVDATSITAHLRVGTGQELHHVLHELLGGVAVPSWGGAGSGQAAG